LSATLKAVLKIRTALNRIIVNYNEGNQ